MNFIELNPDSAFQNALETIDSNRKLVVCSSKTILYMLEENMEEEFSVESTINKSSDVDVAEWFDNCKNALASEEFDISEVEGEWPGEIKEKPGFTLDRDILTNKSISDLVGTEIECDKSWQILAHFNYGGWNECPMPEVHCAIWKYWEEKFGAKIVGVSGDIVEAYVSEPPQTQEEAMALAWEQYFYCPDVVDQGMETVANLAALLMKCETWYFWWD